MPNPQLADEECFKCPEGNRFMRHVKTERDRLPLNTPEEALEYIAIFQCSACHSVKREAFDPKAI